MKCLKCVQDIIGVSKYGLHEECFVEWFKTDVQNEFVSLSQRSAQSQDPEVKSSLNNTSFYHGKFKKYSADLGSESYILKMREAKDAPELPEVEYLCNQIAALVGLPLPEFFYIDFFTEKVFVTKVFIKKGGGSANLEHIYKFRPDTAHDCETLIKVITQTTKLPYDVDVFLNTLLFDALIGNHDRHGRNLAFVVTPSKTVLSPIYDNVSYLSLVSGPLLAADFNPTGRVATKDSAEPAMRHYLDELGRLGYRDVAEQFAQKVKIQKIEQLIDESFCSELMKQALKTLIKKRYKELVDGLQN
ncbi:MAG: HipA domain-containing protein [Bdellovibrio sp.]